MSEPGATCPPGLTLQNYSNIDHSLCGRSSYGCNSTFFSTYGLNYTKVCGKVRGYQFGSVNAFSTGSNNIDSSMLMVFHYIQIINILNVSFHKPV